MLSCSGNIPHTNHIEWEMKFVEKLQNICMIVCKRDVYILVYMEEMRIARRIYTKCDKQQTKFTFQEKKKNIFIRGTYTHITAI